MGLLGTFGKVWIVGWVGTLVGFSAAGQTAEDNALLTAAKAGDRVGVIRARLEGADVDARDENRATALLWAVALDHESVVRALLERGADARLALERELTTPVGRIRPPDQPLHVAVRKERPELVSLLLTKARRLDVNASGAGRDTPLGIAVRRGHATIARQLLQANADPNRETGEPPVTPLLVALRNGHVKIARYLMEAGAVPDRAPAGTERPLHAAVKAGHRSLVATLLKHGAESNARNAEGRTPLDLAKERGDYQIVQLLRQAGAQDRLSTGIHLALSAATFLLTSILLWRLLRAWFEDKEDEWLRRVGVALCVLGGVVAGLALFISRGPLDAVFLSFAGGATDWLKIFFVVAELAVLFIRR